MDRKNILLLLGIIFAVIFALGLGESSVIRNPYYKIGLNTCDQSATTTDCSKISSSVSSEPSQPLGPQPVAYEFFQSQETDKWNIFENIKYHYLIFYLSIAQIISPNNDYALEFSKEKSVEFFIPGKTTLVGVDVETLEPWEEEYFKTATDAEKKILKKKREQFL